MSGAVPEDLTSVDDVTRWLSDNVWCPVSGAPQQGRVGLEAEFFPFWVTPDGRPAARLALVELIGIVDEIDGTERRPDTAGGRPSWDWDGALVTEEPGAQVELAGPPLDDADTAIEHLSRLVSALGEACGARGVGIATGGLDQWSDPGQVPVQLDIPRYQAMTTYFGRRGGEHGHLLMCSSASLQINVDLGPPELAVDRWLLANLVSPALTAAFACSPTHRGVNGRALGWRGLDPTRTGVAPPLVAGSDVVLEHVLADALRGDVMMIQRDGDWRAGEPGWTFGDWLEGDQRGYGAPTDADLATHMTTLFPEARLRGFLEIRGVDMLPAPWWQASVALIVGLLYDPVTLRSALERARPVRGQLPALLEDAARTGLAHPDVGALAGDVLEIALNGARRVAPRHADDAERFLETFTRRREHPADRVTAALEESSAAAFDWLRA